MGSSGINAVHGRCVSYEGPVVDRCIGRGLVPCPVPDHDGVCQRYVRTDNLEFAYAVELDPGGLMYAAAVRGGRRRVATGRVRHHGHVSPRLCVYRMGTVREQRGMQVVGPQRNQESQGSIMVECEGGIT